MARLVLLLYFFFSSRRRHTRFKCDWSADVCSSDLAIIPAAVGVDIGCGMMAVQTTLTASDLPESLREVRTAIERAVPHGFAPRGRDQGSWHTPPAAAQAVWAEL